MLFLLTVLLLVIAFPRETEAQSSLSEADLRILIAAVVSGVIIGAIIVIWIVFLYALHRIEVNKRKTIRSIKQKNAEDELRRRNRQCEVPHVAVSRVETPQFQRTFLSDLVRSPSMEFLETLQDRQRVVTSASTLQPPLPTASPSVNVPARPMQSLTANIGSNGAQYGQFLAPPQVQRSSPNQLQAKSLSLSSVPSHALRQPPIGHSRMHQSQSPHPNSHSHISVSTGYPALRSLADFEECDVLPAPPQYSQLYPSSTEQEYLPTRNLRKGQAVNRKTDRKTDISELSQLTNWPRF